MYKTEKELREASAVQLDAHAEALIDRLSDAHGIGRVEMKLRCMRLGEQMSHRRKPNEEKH